MRRSIYQTTSGLYVAMALAIALILSSYLLLSQARYATKQAFHSRELLLEINETESLLQDAETGQRGYLLTGESKYLAPFITSREALNSHLTNLRTLVKGTNSQEARVRQLDKTINEKMTELEQTMNVRKTSGLSEAIRVIHTDRGKRAMDSARKTINAMANEERLTLSQRSEKVLSYSIISMIIIVLGVLCLFLLIFWQTRTITNDLKIRDDLTDQLRTSEQRFMTTLLSIGDGVLVTDGNGVVTLLNPIASQLTGWSADEAANKNASEVFHIINEASRLNVRSPLEEAIEKNEIIELANHTILISKDGTETFIDDSAAPIRDIAGKVIGAVLVFRDISARKLSRELLMQRQTEVENLNARLQRAMAETHHRVKNNLQIISSLIEMQVIEASSKDTIPIESLKRVGQHIQALAVIHDILTREAKETGNANYLMTAEAFEKLRPLLDTMTGERSLIFETDNFALPIKQGTSLAALVNELVSNAVKHGEGTIELSLRQEKANVKLIVRDHGSGFFTGFDPKKHGNTGLDLIDSLGRWDLLGIITFDNHPQGGGRVTVTFPIVEIVEKEMVSPSVANS